MVPIYLYSINVYKYIYIYILSNFHNYHDILNQNTSGEILKEPKICKQIEIPIDGNSFISKRRNNYPVSSIHVE